MLQDDEEVDVVRALSLDRPVGLTLLRKATKEDKVKVAIPILRGGKLRIMDFVMYPVSEGAEPPQLKVKRSPVTAPRIKKEETAVIRVAADEVYTGVNYQKWVKDPRTAVIAWAKSKKLRIVDSWGWQQEKHGTGKAPTCRRWAW